ncbi:carbon-nitrogen hydrolase family protein [Kiloniella sp. b19]|uniref:carbon-nitrogen hydrolase family protein n=1 Tax=Kiloniella sp. GXU_MW_B19 TaxID=3141326 RepID=UPI0031DF1189
MSSLKLAAAQYPIIEHQSWDGYCAHIEKWVLEAQGGGANLLLFPEYGAMDITALMGNDLRQDLSGQIEALQDFLPDFLRLFSGLAQQQALWIVAPSIPVRVGSEYRNRAYVFGPQGQQDYQEKLVMTRFEREVWNIAGGTEPRVFETAFGTFGINICYDVEFPLIARSQIEAGASLILAPSCTDTLAGYYRVRLGAQARALENQCFVVQSPTVGEALWSPAVDENRGAAGIYSPPDYGLPDDGVVLSGELDRACWIHADLDLKESARIRREGQVFNHRDWQDQSRLDRVQAVVLK